MLSFSEKKALIEEKFPLLAPNPVSLGRMNYQFLESTTDKKNVVYHLHPNGNGFVFVGQNSNYPADTKGLVNIRDFSETDLCKIIEESIKILSIPVIVDIQEEGITEDWINKNNIVLTLVEDPEEELFSIYTEDGLLDAIFNTYSEAIDYLDQEGFELY